MEKTSLKLNIVCFFIPLVGLILFFKNIFTNKKEFAIRCGTTSLIGFFACLITAIYILLFLCFRFYFINLLVHQEVTFMKYENEIEKYERLIEEEQLKNEQLESTRLQIYSRKHVEEIAKEKLGLVMPNEIVFVDPQLWII